MLSAVGRFITNIAQMQNVISAGPETGRPVLLLDGAPPFPENGVALVNALGARGFRASYFTYRGYDARPSYPAETMFGDTISDVAEWLATQPAQVFVVGYSFGGHVALGAALRAPSRVSGVFLLGGFASLTEQIAATRIPVAQAIAAGVDLRAAVLQFLSPKAQQNPAIVELSQKWAATFEPLNTPAFLFSLSHLAMLAEELPRITVPVTQRVGALDVEFGSSVTDELQRSLPNFNVQRVPDAAHLLLLEDFEGTVDAIAEAVK